MFNNCPSDQTRTTSQSCGTATWTPPTATDNVDGRVDVFSDFNPGQCFNVGITTVTYTAFDSVGIPAVCSFVIIVILRGEW